MPGTVFSSGFATVALGGRCHFYTHFTKETEAQRGQVACQGLPARKGSRSGRFPDWRPNHWTALPVPHRSRPVPLPQQQRGGQADKGPSGDQVGAISPCQVTSSRACTSPPPGPSMFCTHQQGISAESVSHTGGSPPSARQLSGLKNEMGRKIHKLWF